MSRECPRWNNLSNVGSRSKKDAFRWEIQRLDDATNRGMNRGTTHGLIKQSDFRCQLGFLAAEFGIFFSVSMIGFSDTGLQLNYTVALI